MSSGRHTKNPVPIMIWGNLRREFESLDDTLTLCDISPKIMNFLYRE